ncbi:MAG: ASCH domain-containing protein [Anaerolineae bacterium]|nr:ASCH domain-containing protein [Anaerolineae bacterium]
MIFEYTLDQVLNGAKTSTRRPVDEKIDSAETDAHGNILAVRVNGREKWRVGKTYAIQPARHARAVGRIRVQKIERQPVRKITDAEARAEGSADRQAFFDLWTEVHGKNKLDEDAWVVHFALEK